MLDAFIEYLKAQIGQPYLWGGQHTKLTPENYVRVIEKKEGDRGKYSDGTTYADAVIDFCKKKFENDATVLYGYDCSGLGVYWLCDLKHLYRCDVNANTMMGRCVLKEGPPRRGWWVFKLSGSKATHIGYMIDDENLVEAKGRKYGVCVTKYKAKDWDRCGIPRVFENEIDIPPVTGQFVRVLGKSVYVRNSDSTKGRILFTAHRGDVFSYIGTAPTGWYEIFTNKGVGYITNKPQYTKLEDKI